MARIAFVVAYAATAIALPCTQATAHTKPKAIREIVRLQGTVRSEGQTCDNGELTIRALRNTVVLCKLQAMRVAVTTVDTNPEFELPNGYDLQGERKTLVPLTRTSPGDKVTILAEWRPGRRDLFVIALDTCGATVAPQ